MKADKINKKQMLLAASVAGLLAVTSGAFMLSAPAFAADDVHCYGVNACKGQGACKGAKNACAGKNACKGMGFVNVDSKDACLSQGGKLTAAASMPSM